MKAESEKEHVPASAEELLACWSWSFLLPVQKEWQNQLFAADYLSPVSHQAPHTWQTAVLILQKHIECFWT